MAKLYWYEIHEDVTKQMTEYQAKKLRQAGKTVVKYKTYHGSDKKLEATTRKSSKVSSYTKPKSMEFLIRHLDFERPSYLIKGVSSCHFCKLDRLECRSYFLLSGKKVSVCIDCTFKQKAKSPTQKANWATNQDALNYSVSGSFGAGKSSR